MKEIPFIKGHMGGNEIVLVNRRHFSTTEELSDSLSILRKPNVRGDQLGLLYEGTGRGKLGAKIVDINSGDYLPMCGGLTQVLGKAYVQLDLVDTLGLTISPGQSTLTLETKLGVFQIRVSAPGGPREVLTEMNPFVEDVYNRGIRQVSVGGATGYFAGDFLVGLLSELRVTYDSIDLEPIDDKSRRALIDFQRAFSKAYLRGKPNRDFVVVDLTSNRSDGRLLFPHNLEEGLTEPSCGTGTVAAVATLLHGGLIKRKGAFRLEFESGGRGDSIGGPDRTVVAGEIKDGKLVDSWLAHDNVKVLASGLLYL
ncbi:hypothetical protein KGY64_04075 [Candidatus Bipolaricaulota bacterium]|nr:hypothetical protein [Candidatus Bipolaricaulota bacterium]